MGINVKTLLKTAGTAALAELGPAGIIVGAAVNSAIDNEKSKVEGDKVDDSTKASAVLEKVEKMALPELAALTSAVNATIAKEDKIAGLSKDNLRTLAVTLLSYCYTADGKFKSIPAAIASVVIILAMAYFGILL